MLAKFVLLRWFKMQNKLCHILVFALATLLLWLYWSRDISRKSKETSNSMFIMNYSVHFTRKSVIEPKLTCKDSPFIVILVTSYVGHVELRSAHRRAMPSNYLAQFNARRIFLLAKIPTKDKYITQEAIIDESTTFGDILQGSFYENYRNLSLKHLMGLKWASAHCYQSNFILKVDDDTVFNLKTTYDMLIKIKDDIDENNFIIGYLLNNTKPKRNKQNKWYVTWKEYPRNEYPIYLSGWYYITTPRLAARLCDEATYHPYFWIDDILVTGLLTEAINVRLQPLPKHFWLEYYELVECCMRDMIKKFIKCDYVVGPNGGRNNLIYEFNEAVTHCDQWKNCSERSEAQSLLKDCVNYRERTIFSNGHPQIINL